MLTNYLAAEQLIIDRLRANTTVPERHVLSAADLANVAEATQPTPALHVIFTGYAPTQEKGDGLIQQTEQTWTVIVVVRNVREAATGTPARRDAGGYLAEVLAALQGWKPSAEHTAMKLAPAPAPGYSSGYGYFPLAFTTRTTSKGTGNG